MQLNLFEDAVLPNAQEGEPDPRFLLPEDAPEEVPKDAPEAVASEHTLKSCAELLTYGPGSAAVWQSERQFMARLSVTPEKSWSGRQRWAAWHMLKKYAVQLEKAGVDFDAFEQPTWIAKPDPIRRISAVIGEDGGDPLFEVKFTFNPNIMRALKTVFVGLTARKEDGYWAFLVEPTRYNVETLLQQAGPLGLEMDEHTARVALKMLEVFEPALARSRAAEPERLHSIPDFALNMRPYQLAGVEYALESKRCIIGDEMGLGKTRQVLGVLKVANAWPAVIVCPASVKENWRREASVAFPGKKIAVVEGTTDRSYRFADLVIVNYDILSDRTTVRDGEATMRRGHAWALSDMAPAFMAWDEAHMLRNIKTKRSQACLRMAESAEYRIAASGTPFVNRPLDLVPVLHVIDQMGLFGSELAFKKRYCPSTGSSKYSQWKGAAYLSELNTKLRAACYVRRLKSEVATELPPIQRIVEPATLSEVGWQEYRKAEAELVLWMEEQAQKVEQLKAGTYKLQPGEQMPKLRNIQAAMAWEVLMRIGVLRAMAGRYKTECITAWVKEFLANTDEKLLLFAWQKDVIAHYSAAFFAPVITGDTPVKKRQTIVDTFQSDPECRVLVLNIQAGGTGLNIDQATHVAFAELAWTPAEIDQAIARAHRLTTTRPITAWFLNVPQTIDCEIFDAVEQKRLVVDAATEGDTVREQRGVQAQVVRSFMARGGIADANVDELIQGGSNGN